MKATYTRLPSGAWGLRIEGDAMPGTAITVTKKDGTRKTETIGGLVQRFGQGVSTYEIGGASSGARNGNPTFGGARKRRPWAPCGYPGCHPSYCDECNGDGWGN